MMREVKMRKNVSSRKVRRNSAVAKAVSQGPGLFPGTVFPSMGDQKAIVVLVQYKDVKFKLGDPKDYFTVSAIMVGREARSTILRNARVGSSVRSLMSTVR